MNLLINVTLAEREIEILECKERKVTDCAPLPLTNKTTLSILLTIIKICKLCYQRNKTVNQKRPYHQQHRNDF